MNIIFNARSIDAYQKSVGNLVAIATLGEEIASRLKKNLKVPVWVGSIDGMIADAHIYENTFEEAKELINSYKMIEAGEVYEKK